MKRALLAAMLVALMARAAWAQGVYWDEGVSYDPWAISATVEEVEDLCKATGGGPETLGAAKSLVEGCQAVLTRSRRHYQRASERAWLTHTREEQAEVSKILEKESESCTKAHDEACAALLGDLKAILPKDSDAAWAAFERRRHRRLFLHQSWRVGVGVDLFEVAKAEKIDEVPAVREVLAPYELELDKFLVARDPMVAEYGKKVQKATEAKDDAAIERAFAELRDLDCGIMHLQRETAAKLLKAAPMEKQGALKDRLLTARAPYVNTETRLTKLAEKLVKSGRLKEKEAGELRGAVEQFNKKSRSLDDANLSKSEDVQCSQTYAQSMSQDENTSQEQLKWYDESRRLQKDLLGAIEKVATEDDLDAVDEEP